MTAGTRREPGTREAPEPAEPPAAEIDLGRLLAALADPHRRVIVQLLAAEGEVSCAAALRETRLSASAASHHFKILRLAGLTHTRRLGTHRIMSLRERALQERFPGLIESVLRAIDEDSGPRTPGAGTATTATTATTGATATETTATAATATG